MKIFRTSPLSDDSTQPIEVILLAFCTIQLNKKSFESKGVLFLLTANSHIDCVRSIRMTPDFTLEISISKTNFGFHVIICYIPLTFISLQWFFLLLYVLWLVKQRVRATSRHSCFYNLFYYFTSNEQFV